MIGSTARRIAAGALALTGLIHLVLAPEYMNEQAYIGLLFVAGGISSIALAAWLWLRNQAVAWLAAAAVCSGMAVGFVLSRTLGLPGFHEAEWELSGMISVLLEIGVVGLAAAALGGALEESTEVA